MTVKLQVFINTPNNTHWFKQFIVFKVLEWDLHTMLCTYICTFSQTDLYIKKKSKIEIMKYTFLHPSLNEMSL